MTLSAEEVAWIKANRAGITAGNTVTVTLVRVIKTGEDPYTGEPIESTVEELADVVWKPYGAISEEDRFLASGIEIRQGDVSMSVDVAVDLSDVETVRYGGDDWTIITADPKGLGAVNRHECLVRRVI